MSDTRFTSTRISIAVGLAIGMASGSAVAVGLSNVMTTGTNIAYFELDPTDCTTMKATSTPSDLDPIVQGSSAMCVPNSDQGPGGNIEAGDDDAMIPSLPAQTIEGDFDFTPGPVETLMVTSLVKTDWTTEYTPGLT